MPAKARSSATGCARCRPGTPPWKGGCAPRAWRGMRHGIAILTAAPRRRGLRPFGRASGRAPADGQKPIDEAILFEVDHQARRVVIHAIYYGGRSFVQRAIEDDPADERD